MPVSASMRRTPAAIPASETILNRPMSPAARTWVPPHNSMLTSPTRTTRTESPYFSSNRAVAPASMASLIGIWVVTTGALSMT